MPAPQVAAFEDRVRAMVNAYRTTLPSDRRHLLSDYRYVHSARKVVGVGSVGTRAWIVLMSGRDEHDPLLLQAKEAQPSVLEPYAGPSAFEQARRTGGGGPAPHAGQQRHPARVAARKGLDGEQRDFYIRQLRDWKGSWDPEGMTPAILGVYGQLCARTLARAHARSGDRIAIASYLGKAAASTARSPSSPRRTPTRTSVTTRRCRRRCERDGARPAPACERSGTAQDHPGERHAG